MAKLAQNQPLKRICLKLAKPGLKIPKIKMLQWVMTSKSIQTIRTIRGDGNKIIEEVSNGVYWIKR